MENASKALLISGGILIAMLVLAIGVILVTAYSELGNTYETKLSSNEVQKFNSRFIEFQYRENVTAQEIVSLSNYVRNYNKEMETNIEVKVTNSEEVNGNFSDKNETKDLMKFIKNNSTKEVGEGEAKQVKTVYFECKPITNYDEDGRVKKIEFIKIT